MLHATAHAHNAANLLISSAPAPVGAAGASSIWAASSRSPLCPSRLPTSRLKSGQRYKTRALAPAAVSRLQSSLLASSTSASSSQTALPRPASRDAGCVPVQCCSTAASDESAMWFAGAALLRTAHQRWQQACIQECSSDVAKGVVARPMKAVHGRNESSC